MPSAAVEWRVVEWAPKYDVSNDGRVRSRKRKVPKIMTPIVVAGGHEVVTLSNCVGNHQIRVCQLVALGWLPVPGHCKVSALGVEHLDGDVTNNRVENLRWCGRNTWKRKLTEDDVRAIRGSSARNADIAFVYEVNPNTIRGIKCNRSWRHVE